MSIDTLIEVLKHIPQGRLTKDVRDKRAISSEDGRA